MRRCYITLIQLVLWVITSHAQYKEPVIETGQTMPDIPLKLVNGDQILYGRLSDYKGKRVIFDYWDQWCSACIGAFPKAQKIQEKYGDNLVIIAITSDSFIDFKRIREKYRNIKNSSLLFAVEDTMLKNIVHPPSVPLYIWVDTARILDAIVPPSRFNDSTISSYMNGIYWSYNMSKDYELLKSKNRLFIEKTPTKEIGAFKYNSRIRKTPADMLAKQGWSSVRDDQKTIGKGFWNRPLSELYMWAFVKDGILNDKYIVSADPTLQYLMKPCVPYQQGYDTWELETSYDYLLLAEDVDSHMSEVYIALKKDLDDKFSIDTRLVDTTVQTLQLVRIPNKAPIKSGMQDNTLTSQEINGRSFRMKSSPPRMLTEALEDIINLDKRCNCISVIDKSGINYNFDIDITLKDNSIKSINEALYPFGLAVKESTETRKVVVLSRMQIGSK